MSNMHHRSFIQPSSFMNMLNNEEGALYPYSEAIELFAQWKGFKVKGGTVNSYVMELRHFGIHMNDCSILLPHTTIEHVVNWLNLHLKFKYDRNSLPRKASALKAFFKYWYLQLKDHVLDPELIPIPEAEYKPPRLATREDYQKLLSAIPKENNQPRNLRNRSLLNLLYATGARIGEILSLDVDNINFGAQNAIINTEKSKGKRPNRLISWETEPEANDNLKRWIEKREYLLKYWKSVHIKAVFIGVNHQKRGERLTNSGVAEFMRRLSHKAELPYIVNCHAFRHFKGHRMMQNGAPLQVVSNILGHSSIQSTMVYQRLTDKELLEQNARYDFQPA